jgi:MtN3 and saliva related transmembrane protein
MKRAAVVLLALSVLPGCEDLRVRDVQSLLVPELMKSEIVGLVAGFGTTFAAMPDLITMFRRRSSAGMNPRMAAIMAVFQVAWIYYGLLILSRPVVTWNAIAVVINLLSVTAFFHFARKESEMRIRDREPLPD